MNINERIRKVRKDNNLTQEEFAEIINVSRSTVALYEKGLRKPDINIINIICKHFDLSVDEFYGDSSLSNKRISKIRIFVLSFLTILLVTSSIVTINFIRVTNMYGYNIYNDELKVKNSTDICIVKINDKVSNGKDSYTYDILVIDVLKYNNTEDKYVYNRVEIDNSISLDFNKNIYLLFNNVSLKNINNDSYHYNCDICITSKYFIEELPDYDEAVSYDKQTGKSKRIIDYYLNLIEKNK